MKLTYTFWSVKLIFGTYITLGAINVFSCCDKLSIEDLRFTMYKVQFEYLATDVACD